MWLSNLDYGEIVEAVWRNTDEIGVGRNVLEKIQKCGKDLSWWNKNVFGNGRKELERLRKLLPKAEIIAMASRNNDQVRKIKKDIEELLGREEIMWAQRSRLL